MRRGAPGSWPSSLSPQAVAAGQLRLQQPRLAAGAAFWLETRPAEQGRTVLMRAGEAGQEELTPAPYSVRSRVHEYGGGAYAVDAGRVFFVNDIDQRLYVIDGAAPKPLTTAGTLRYGDLLPDAACGRLICICEDHAVSPPRNFLATVSFGDGAVAPLTGGRDFFSSPALSPDGRQLAWLSWDLPHTPWESSELWLAHFDRDGRLREPQRIAGGPGESVFQPRFAPDGVLHFVSDQSGYWNLYRHADGVSRALAPEAADYGYAQWNLGMSSYGFLSATSIAAVRLRRASAEVVLIDTATGKREALAGPYTQIEHLDAADGRLVLTGSAPDRLSQIAEHGTGGWRTLRRLDGPGLDRGFISLAQAVTFPTSDSEEAHGWYYPPQHPDMCVAEGELPPLLVKCHGGPTAMDGDGLEPRLQFWTSRGYAVLQVNYRGSTGYGRAYRESLKGQWGVKDVWDCVNGARYLAERGLADPKRCLISGASAGGFTALSTLTHHEVFRAGTMYYGLSELASAMRDTHKFEAGYGDWLLGPWPAAQEVYRERSPLYAAERIRAPVLFFQGLKDKVVPPEQTARMVEALRKNRVPVASLSFPEEGHGFRRAETLQRCLEAELAFHARILGFTPADGLP
ncbi:MAG TPA: S9 family peptidase, partial [Gammaproteobacteria bacterium]|nr:S9 family peptidase [Gammaproteobacteria bacterium]